MKVVHGVVVYIFGLAVYIHDKAVNRFVARQICNTLTTNTIFNRIKLLFFRIKTPAILCFLYVVPIGKASKQEVDNALNPQGDVFRLDSCH